MKKIIKIAGNQTLGEIMTVLAVKSGEKKASVSVVEGAIETAFEAKTVNKLQGLGWRVGSGRRIWTKGSKRNNVVFDVH